MIASLVDMYRRANNRGYEASSRLTTSSVQELLVPALEDHCPLRWGGVVVDDDDEKEKEKEQGQGGGLLSSLASFRAELMGLAHDKPDDAVAVADAAALRFGKYFLYHNPAENHFEAEAKRCLAAPMAD